MGKQFNMMWALAEDAKSWGCYSFNSYPGSLLEIWFDDESTAKAFMAVANEVCNIPIRDNANEGRGVSIKTKQHFGKERTQIIVNVGGHNANL